MNVRHAVIYVMILEESKAGNHIKLVQYPDYGLLKIYTYGTHILFPVLKLEMIL